MQPPSGSKPPHFLHVFPTFVAAGAQQRTIQLMRAFGSRYRHSVLALDGRTPALDLLPEALDVRPVERGDRHPAGLRGMRALLARLSPDLLLTYNWGSFDAVLAARSLRLRRHVHHEDGFNVDEARRQKWRRVIARRFALRGAQRVVVPSRNLLEIGRRVWRLPERRLLFVPNGIALEHFEARARAGPPREELRASLGIPARDLVIGAVGHLRPVKNFGRLIAACGALPPDAVQGRGVHLLLLGDGPERERLEQLAEAHTPPGGHVHFAGHQNDLAPYYRAMDVFALSSDSEQHPVSLLEAMAMKLPVAATNVGDVRAVLPSAGERFVVGLENDPLRGLTQALSALLSDAESRAELGRAGYDRVADVYSFDAMVRAYEEVYEAALRA